MSVEVPTKPKEVQGEAFVVSDSLFASILKKLQAAQASHEKSIPTEHIRVRIFPSSVHEVNNTTHEAGLADNTASESIIS